jgi:hypothetical protein
MLPRNSCNTRVGTAVKYVAYVREMADQFFIYFVMNVTNFEFGIVLLGTY